MDWMTWLVFESLGALAVVLGTVLFGLLVYWRRQGRPRPLAVGLGVTLVLLVAQSLVVTKREHAGRILATIEANLVKSNTDALAAALAPDFEAEGMDRDAFMDFVHGRMQKAVVMWVDRKRLQVKEASSDRFVASASYWAEIMLDRFPYAFRSRWSLTFVHTAQGWQIAHVHAESIDGLGDPSFDNIARQQ